MPVGRQMIMNVAIFGAFLLIFLVLGFFLWQTLFSPEQHGELKEKAEISHSEQAAGENDLVRAGPAKHANNLTDEKWLAVFTLCLVIATVGLFVSGERNVEVARDAAAAAKQSADAAKRAVGVAEQTMVASQRAWIKIKVDIGNVLTFDESGASTTVTFELTNVGQAPALHITMNAWLGVLKSGGPFAWQEREAKCAEIRKQRIGGGFTLFPGDQFPAAIGIGGYSVGVNVNKDELAKGMEISADKKHVALFVVGCVDYTFATDPETHHQTAFMFDLHRMPPKLFSPNDGVIPQAELKLMEAVLGGIAAD